MPIQRHCVFLALGLILAPRLPWQNVMPWWAWFALCTFIGLFLFWRKKINPALFFVGVLWSSLYALWVHDDTLNPSMWNRVLWIEGTIEGLPTTKNGATQFDVVHPHSRRDIPLPKRIQVTWRQAPTLHTGESWRLALLLKPAQGTANPQGFDYSTWLKSKGVGALASVKDGHLLGTRKDEGLRQHLRDRLLAFQPFQQGAALAALVVGDGSGLTREDWQLLQHTGTMHLLVISGQHIMLMAAVVYGLIWQMAKWGVWPARIPWLASSCLLAWLVALGYGWLAGMEVPVQRALISLTGILFCRWWFQQWSGWLFWWISLVLVLLINPLASFLAGFWLSFGAVACLLWVFLYRRRSPHLWGAWWRSQWAVTLALLPLMVSLGLSQSLMAPICNLVVGPIVSVFSVPLALLGTLFSSVPMMGDLILMLAAASLKGVFFILTFMSELLPIWHPTEASMVSIILAVLAGGLIVAPIPWLLRMTLLLLWVPLLVPRVSQIEWGKAQILVMDVGQGSAVWIKTRAHNLLYDTGPKLGVTDMAERVVMPVLRYGGVRNLDQIIISHADLDHVGGLEAILKHMPTQTLISGEPKDTKSNMPVGRCDEKEWFWDGVRFQLWQWQQGEGNSASCVLMIEAKNERLWLGGDLDEEGEGHFLQNFPEYQARWFLSPHHGSRTSSSDELLQQLKPSYALISRGVSNQFGHPHPSILQRYEHYGIDIHDTALDGSIMIELGGHKPAVLARQP